MELILFLRGWSVNSGSADVAIMHSRPKTFLPFDVVTPFESLTLYFFLDNFCEQLYI
jgi:hypothetical protein